MGRLDWRGDEVKRMVVENLKAAIGEFALTVEGESKRELRRGHGVETGTLRRSIHTAGPDYAWGSDDVTPGGGTPERGGQVVEGQESGSRITVQVGSGIRYAMAVHQGHHNFQGYHYITNGLSRAKAQLRSILERHQVKR